jgi:hypothetical protein
VTDTHVHIGQFEDHYYKAEDVFETALEAGTGIERIVFSSTTSCKDDVRYREVEQETAAALALPVWGEKADPLFWFVPAYVSQGVTVERAMGNLPYRGIKIHPLARFILAHGRPVEQTAKLLKEFPHVYCDTAFMPQNDFNILVKESADKITLGSDFPITYHFNREKYPDRKGPEYRAALRRQYREDCGIMKGYQEAKDLSGR